MVFTTPRFHEEVWTKIKAATEAGKLGFESKTPNPENRFYPFLRAMLTCVYTYDVEDVSDVRRVLVALRELDLMNARLSYKRDADTLGGWYGEGVATYVSQPRSLGFEDRRQA
jgi:Bles03-like protein